MSLPSNRSVLQGSCASYPKGLTKAASGAPSTKGSCSGCNANSSSFRIGRGQQAEAYRSVRRARRGRQGRRHQAHRATAEPQALPDRCLGQPHRARAGAVVFPAVCHALTGRRGNRVLRPQLVQQGGRRARHGLLLGRGILRVPPVRARFRADDYPLRHCAHQILVLHHL